MNEDQKKWLLYLQENGIQFENVSLNGMVWHIGVWEFKNDPKDYRLPVQSIPDIPDWRDLCMEMQDRGIRFYHKGVLDRRCIFGDIRENYSVQPQPIPEWSNEEMTEETKQETTEEIPHREQQIQWHEDKIHSLETGEPMREWQFRHVLSDGAVSEWSRIYWPEWGSKDVEYRRKPRTVTYWHCLVRYVTGAIEFEVLSDLDRKYLVKKIEEMSQYAKKCNRPIQFSPITETTVEMED